MIRRFSSGCQLLLQKSVSENLADFNMDTSERIQMGGAVRCPVMDKSHFALNVRVSFS